MQLSSLITPSPAWLTACQSHLRGNATDESIWNQILHSDLRDVVDGFAEQGNHSSNHGAATASRLRACIAQSTQDGKSSVELTHMVQIEEVVDVSLNSEGMLGSVDPPQNNGGSTANTNNNSSRVNANNQRGPNNNNRSKSRMLKLVVSDGYNPTNNSSSNGTSNTDNNSTMLAMETSSIPSLSPQTPPGTKLLLFSTLIIRHGILQLNCKNCLVLGGRISSWEVLANEKREKLKRMKGMGVDATVRALVWSNDENLDEVDEGEGESRDVTAPRQQPQMSSVSSLPSSGSNSNTNVSNNSTARSSTGSNRDRELAPIFQRANESSNSSMKVQNQNPNSSNNYQSTSLQTMISSKNPYQNNHSGNNNSSSVNPYQRNNNPYSQSSSGSNTFQQRNNTNPYQQHQNGNPCQQNSNGNPYQRNSNRNSNSQNMSQSSNDSPTKNQVQTNDKSSTTQNNRTSLPRKKYESSSCIPPRISDVSSNSCFGSSNTVSQGTQQHPHQAAALRNIQPRVSPSNPPAVTPATAKKASTINSSIQSVNPSPNKGSESFSFSELKYHLVQLSQNRGFYEANYGKTFVVPCKLKNGKEEKRVFNTVKDKKGSKKGDKKYEFLLHSYFYGPKSSDGHIACRIQSSLMEPYFSGHTPSDIRKLQKTEKERAVKLVNDSSTQFLHEFASLAEIHIKLMYRPDEFFAKIGSLGDGWVEVLEDPLLIVVDRKTG